MEKQEVAQRVKEIISETLETELLLNNDTHLINDLNTDSIDQLSIIMAIEDEFDGEIDNTKIVSIQTVADVIEITWSRLQQDA